jgi:hypothetical protein
LYPNLRTFQARRPYFWSYVMRSYYTRKCIGLCNIILFITQVI